jgi:hypothetical protein
MGIKQFRRMCLLMSFAWCVIFAGGYYFVSEGIDQRREKLYPILYMECDTVVVAVRPVS